jgi:hypothetical protein
LFNIAAKVHNFFNVYTKIKMGTLALTKSYFLVLRKIFNPCLPQKQD